MNEICFEISKKTKFIVFVLVTIGTAMFAYAFVNPVQAINMYFPGFLTTTGLSPTWLLILKGFFFFLLIYSLILYYFLILWMLRGTKGLIISQNGILNNTTILNDPMVIKWSDIESFKLMTKNRTVNPHSLNANKARARMKYININVKNCESYLEKVPALKRFLLNLLTLKKNYKSPFIISPLIFRNVNADKVLQTLNQKLQNYCK